MQYEHAGAVQIGAVLAGRYRVDRVLGAGGMGVVVQAMHLQLHQPVAIKFLLPEMLGNPQVIQRFLREAQAAVRLRSEHVARVIDVSTTETGAPYMVLEYLEGADLVHFAPRPAVGVVVDLMLQACEALAEAHAAGIVHRDIKPANLFVTRGADGALVLKVLDFGISKTQATSGQLTAPQAVMGTPAYMSPEQMRSSQGVDHRSDIWSLGAVLYELLQGSPPFRGDTFSSLVLKVVNDPLPVLTVRLPGDLDAVVYRCLEKDPAKRFQTTAELAQALARYAQSETQAAISVQRTRAIAGAKPLGPVLDPASAQRAPSTISGASGAVTPREHGRRRWSIVAVVGVLIGGVAIAVVAVSGDKDTRVPSPNARPEAAAETALAPPDAATPDAALAAPFQATQRSNEPTTLPPPAPQPAAPQPVAPPPVAVSPRSTAAPAPPSTTAHRPTRIPTTSASPARPVAPPARPQGADDEILRKRK